MDVKRFEGDLSKLVERLCRDETQKVCDRLEHVKESLVSMYRQNLVKINHSVLELLCTKYLAKLDYDVTVEQKLAENLVCDVYGTKGDGALIVEIETGFVPPAHALDPLAYCNARIASKTARYSAFAGKFALGTTPMNILRIPQIFEINPRHRKLEEIKKVKELCDKYYDKPKISLEQLTYATVHSIYVLDIDWLKVIEVSPELYGQRSSAMTFGTN